MHCLAQQVRRASTLSHNFPFPTNVRPTPHQIFHLAPGATQAAIKSRYYELVKVHHPDSPLCRNVPANIRHARFQAITHAYEVLKGKHGPHAYDPAMEELERRRRAMAHRARPRTDFANARTADFNWDVSANRGDTVKDWFIIAMGLMALAAGLFPTMWFPIQDIDKSHRLASANLARARAEAREFGEERRLEIRKRVQEMRDNKSDVRLAYTSVKPKSEPPD